MTINPRICTVVNTAVVAGILYKAIPLGPRSQVAQVQLTAVDKQIAVSLGSAAAAFLLVGFVSRMVLWLQNPNRIRPSSKLDQKNMDNVKSSHASGVNFPVKNLQHESKTVM
ncbi:hypothetical protein RvY_06094 [Ramazzottius varieornatus]|uniref:Uncharacterized protein n=1 Tax=Ramazzottius varieornatus TaxID=947166 RepID=A0A1D1UXC9_RAMVA|nr:hypothetical protein RvY_06094 [Ramazzottius varieornatus]